MLKNKNRIIAAIMSLSIILAVGCSSDNSSNNSSGVKGVKVKEIRIATQPIPNYAPIFVAKQKKWIEQDMAKVGVKVKWTSFASGPPENESLASGSQDIGMMGDSPAFIGKSVGQDTSIIASSSIGPKALAVMVSKDSKITSPKQLKGKKVAVVKGSYAHHLLYLILKNNNMTTDDVQLINMDTNGDISSAIANKNIDAGVVWEPTITQMENKGTGKVLVDGTDVKLGICIYVIRNKFAEENPELVKIFLKDVQRGAEFEKQNLNETAKLISTEVNLPQDQLVKVLPKYNFNPYLTNSDVEELKKTQEFMKESNLITTSVDVDKFVNKDYLQQAGIKEIN
ncbi:aliphatic sulfonate ABC transporter substrate-binding protein [Clostridium tyrobutyricum]|uniref:aliphatic sulfonate ABC transporter substrate-binding protein n=1 Tax=Clostridium tyrobutyricum TaxID=1519 RepID=UPI001C3915A1|nr:aliphatic sulfonate ABC transporter substrate-binding protein [Clostridium tyrobutyricum]MBV4419445.1 aliphatic sulfonate ABC transporter substrate-binding protein [Clostridium tyrobutyricum]